MLDGISSRERGWELTLHAVGKMLANLEHISSVCMIACWLSVGPFLLDMARQACKDRKDIYRSICVRYIKPETRWIAHVLNDSGLQFLWCSAY